MQFLEFTIEESGQEICVPIENLLITKLQGTEKSRIFSPVFKLAKWDFVDVKEKYVLVTLMISYLQENPTSGPMSSKLLRKILEDRNENFESKKLSRIFR